MGIQYLISLQYLISDSGVVCGAAPCLKLCPAFQNTNKFSSFQHQNGRSNTNIKQQNHKYKYIFNSVLGHKIYWTHFFMMTTTYLPWDVTKTLNQKKIQITFVVLLRKICLFLNYHQRGIHRGCLKRHKGNCIRYKCKFSKFRQCSL